MNNLLENKVKEEMKESFNFGNEESVWFKWDKFEEIGENYHLKMNVWYLFKHDVSI